MIRFFNKSRVGVVSRKPISSWNNGPPRTREKSGGALELWMFFIRYSFYIAIIIESKGFGCKRVSAGYSVNVPLIGKSEISMVPVLYTDPHPASRCRTDGARSDMAPIFSRGFQPLVRHSNVFALLHRQFVPQS